MQICIQIARVVDDGDHYFAVGRGKGAAAVIDRRAVRYAERDISEPLGMVARGGSVKVYVVRNLRQLQAKVYFRVLVARRLRMLVPRRFVGHRGYGNVEVGLIFICICAVGSICYRRYLAAEMSLRSKCIVTVHGDIYNSYCFAVNLNFDISPRLIFCRVSCDFKRGNLAVAAVVEEQVIVFRSVYV